jgi:hypothetical protein
MPRITDERREARREQVLGAARAPGAGVDPEAAAELLTSICLGFAARRALAGDAEARAHVAALEAR